MDQYTFRFLHIVGPHCSWLDHSLCGEVRAMLCTQVSRSPLGGVRQRYAELVEAVARDLAYAELTARKYQIIAADGSAVAGTIDDWWDYKFDNEEDQANRDGAKDYYRLQAETALTHYPLPAKVVEFFRLNVKEYGHSSPLELLGPAAFIEHLSRWAAWLTFDEPLVAGQEMSTRAIWRKDWPIAIDACSEPGTLGPDGKPVFKAWLADERVEEMHHLGLAIAEAEIEAWKVELKAVCEACHGRSTMAPGGTPDPDCDVCKNTGRKYPWMLDPQPFRPAFDRARWALPGTIETGVSHTAPPRVMKRVIQQMRNFAEASRHPPALALVEEMEECYRQMLPGLHDMGGAKDVPAEVGKPKTAAAAAAGSAAWAQRDGKPRELGAIAEALAGQHGEAAAQEVMDRIGQGIQDTIAAEGFEQPILQGQTIEVPIMRVDGLDAAFNRYTPESLEAMAAKDPNRLRYDTAMKALYARWNPGGDAFAHRIPGMAVTSHKPTNLDRHIHMLRQLAKGGTPGTEPPFGSGPVLRNVRHPDVNPYQLDPVVVPIMEAHKTTFHGVSIGSEENVWDPSLYQDQWTPEEFATILKDRGLAPPEAERAWITSRSPTFNEQDGVVVTEGAFTYVRRASVLDPNFTVDPVTQQVADGLMQALEQSSSPADFIMNGPNLEDLIDWSTPLTADLDMGNVKWGDALAVNMGAAADAADVYSDIVSQLDLKTGELLDHAEWEERWNLMPGHLRFPLDYTLLEDLHFTEHTFVTPEYASEVLVIPKLDGRWASLQHSAMRRTSRRMYADPVFNRSRLEIDIPCSLAAATDWHRHRTFAPWVLRVIRPCKHYATVWTWHNDIEMEVIFSRAPGPSGAGVFYALEGLIARMDRGPQDLTRGTATTFTWNTGTEGPTLQVQHASLGEFNVPLPTADAYKVQWGKLRIDSHYAPISEFGKENVERYLDLCTELFDHYLRQGNQWMAMTCLPLGTAVLMQGEGGLRNGMYMLELRSTVKGKNFEYAEQAEQGLTKLETWMRNNDLAKFFALAPE